MSLVASRPDLAAAQQEVPVSGPLPTIIYPSRPSQSAQRDVGPAKVAPESEADPDDDWPVRYLIVGGSWGFWDRHRHFHPASARIAHVLRSRAIAYRAAPVTHNVSFGRDRMHR